MTTTKPDPLYEVIPPPEPPPATYVLTLTEGQLQMLCAACKDSLPTGLGDRLFPESVREATDPGGIGVRGMQRVDNVRARLRLDPSGEPLVDDAE